MPDTVTCPRCGTENSADAMNCDACRINLRFALENPAEIERIKREDADRDQSVHDMLMAGRDGRSATTDEPILLPVLLLLGSFVFAFCLGEAVHELGHFFVHRAYGVEVGVRLDPFGGSRILQGSSAPQGILGITSLAGPLLNLLIGLTLSLSLWRIRRPLLLPMVLWGPLSLVQEGVTFSLGMLTPGGDAELIVDWGVPAFVLVSLGVLFLVLGIALICWLLPLVGLSPADSFSRKFGIVAGGMLTFMVIRLLVSGFGSPNLLVENTVPLVFSLLLATIVVVAYRRVYSVLGRVSRTQLESVTRREAVTSMALGVSMVLLQLVTFN